MEPPESMVWIEVHKHSDFDGIIDFKVLKIPLVGPCERKKNYRTTAVGDSQKNIMFLFLLVCF